MRIPKKFETTTYVKLYPQTQLKTLFLFYGWRSIASKLQSHHEEGVYFLPLSSQIFLGLIWSTSEGWKSELTLEPPSGFEHSTLGLKILQLGNSVPINMAEPLKFKSWQTGTDGKTNKNQNQHCFQLSNADPTDTKYLYSPHVEGVTQKGSLLPAYAI